jgi:hypothetical protein
VYPRLAANATMPAMSAIGTASSGRRPVRVIVRARPVTATSTATTSSTVTGGTWVRLRKP